ncbi:pyrroline-5-carboxylate reductase [Streptomyces sp. NPDC051776]|uniref:pyrroline-5-carboxylate reductase n=1 Tax=Streptomyces sp. NPDC051776 TaxID=3155414 RepID=UPI003417E68C
MTDSMHRVVVIGAGHMGTAIIAGLREKAGDLPLEVVEIAQSRMRAVREEFGIIARSHYTSRPGDTVVLAIQPQQFEEFAAAQGRGAFEGVLVISVMAGVSTAVVGSRLDTGGIVRAIPNTPSEVSQGMTVMCPGPAVTPGETGRAERVLSAIGQVLTVADEALIDDATALCGGGPAFVAHIAGAFIEFAVKAGFRPAEARLMSCQVLRGTADLLGSTGREPDQLCREVMTPGGTTERGVFHLLEQGLRDVLVEALRLSANRSRQLGDLARTDPPGTVRPGGSDA